MALAKMMADSDLVPTAYRGKPGNVLISVQMGLEVGLGPMAAVQSIAVINGKPSLYGDAGKALLLARGCIIEEDDIAIIKKTGVARCKITRQGRPPVERTFSIDNAKTAGLWMKKGNQGQDTPWVTYPERQLSWRAFWFAARDAASDILKGLAGAEELADIPPEKDVTPQRTVDRVEAKVAQAAGQTGPIIDKTTGEIIESTAETATRTAQDILVDVEAAADGDVMRKLREEIAALPKGPEKIAAGKAWEARLKVLKEAAKATQTPTVDDAIAAVRQGDYDLAADISRGLSEKDKALIEEEIKAAKTKAAS